MTRHICSVCKKEWPSEGAHVCGTSEGTRPLAELTDSGLLWLINAAVFHPRGFALAIHFGDDDVATGWSIVGDGTEPWRSDDDIADARFVSAEATLARLRPPVGGLSQVKPKAPVEF